MSSPRWTADQRRAIEAGAGSLLVSAAAGSGKTSVLAARCAHLVCDAPSPLRCGVGQLLVVTFTEAAAAEMKARIERALRGRLAQGDDDDGRLRTQVALVEHASISTLHAFCLRLIRQHFPRLRIDPGFRVLDGDEAVLLRLDVARDLFLDRYEAEDGAFRDFVDAYGSGDDESLMHLVKETHEMLESLVEPAGWMERSRRRIAEGAQRPLAQSELGQEYLSGLRERLAALREECAAAIDAIPATTFPRYVTYAQVLAATAAHWELLLERDGLEALAAEVRGFKAERLPSYGKDLDGKEAAQAVVNRLRDRFSKGPLADSLLFTAQEWREGLQAVRPHGEVFLDLVAEFGKRYRAEKDRLRAVDFSDLERFALELLREPEKPGLVPSPVARACHNQFRHVLVDEYQDINEVQDAILHLVSRECIAGTRGEHRPANLFCVGDVKQSIYRFRLAEPTRFLAREARFRDGNDDAGAVIDLQANFRSRAPLLATINNVFARLMTRAAADIEYDESHELRPGADYPPAETPGQFHGAPIELHLLPDKFPDAGMEEGEGNAPELETDRARREATVVAATIRKLLGETGGPRMEVTERGPDGAMVARPIELRDIVVLLRSLKFQAEHYADVLRRHGIPVHNTAGSGFFESMEVRDVFSLLRVLNNQRQDVPMAAVLRSPLAGLPRPEDALAMIRLAYPAPADGNGLRVAFHEAVGRYAAEHDDELAAKLRDFLADLARWRVVAHQRPVADLLWQVYEETGFMAFCNGLENGTQRCANLVLLHEKARQFGTFSRQGLYRFMKFLENLAAQTDPGQAADAAETDNVVRIMSVHKSKGLEFPVVIAPDIGKRINLRDAQGVILADRQAGLGLQVADEVRRVRYPSLAHALVQARLRQQSLAEELRVLYVAMTRAKEHLVLIGSCREKDPDTWTARYRGHAGALPTDTILGATTMLDWLGPVAAAIAGTGRESIELHRHSAEALAAMAGGEAARRRGPGTPAPLVKLEPLEPAPPMHAEAGAVIERLGAAYRYAAFAGIEAARAATAVESEIPNLKSQISDLKSQIPDSRSQPSLSLPRFLGEAGIATAADRGAVTHLLLQHLDFSRPCTGDDLGEQIDALVTGRHVTAAQAAAIDRAGIEWLMGTDVGQLLRRHAKGVRREVEFAYAMDAARFGGPASEDPEDRVMVRGRVDVLIPVPGGLVLIDYKTGNAARAAELHGPQVALYREAVERITQQAVVAAQLVFLTARVVVAV